MTGLGELAIEHGAVDDRAVDTDPKSTQIHVAAAHVHDAEKRLVAAGFAVLDASQTIVRLQSADRAAAQRTADALAASLHVVARAVPTPMVDP